MIYQEDEDFLEDNINTKININREKEIYLDIILNELILSNFDCILI